MDMTYWCESCARKSNCYTISSRPKCFVPITNTDTPQTFDKPSKCLGCVYSELDKAFHPCASCEDFSKYFGELSGTDTPQTEQTDYEQITMMEMVEDD